MHFVYITVFLLLYVDPNISTFDICNISLTVFGTNAMREMLMYMYNMY